MRDWCGDSINLCELSLLHVQCRSFSIRRAGQTGIVQIMSTSMSTDSEVLDHGDSECARKASVRRTFAIISHPDDFACSLLF